MLILNQKIKKSLLFTVDTIGILVVFTVAFFFWRLYQGSINADFLKPYIIHSISSDKIPFNFDIANVELEWGKDKRLIDITATELTITDKEDNTWVVLPKIAIALSLKNIFNGEITPHLIDIISPLVRIYHENDNSFSFTIGEKTSSNQSKKMTLQEISALFGGFLDKSSSEQFKQKNLDFIKISHAELDFIDLAKNRNINFKDFSFDFSKDYNVFALTLNFNTEFLGQNSFAQTKIFLDTKKEDTSFIFNFNNFNPSYFSEFFPEFKRVAFPINGSISLDAKTAFLENIFTNNDNNIPYLSFFKEDTIKNVKFDIKGKTGILNLPAPISNQYMIYSLNAKGSAFNLNKISFNTIDVKSGETKASISGDVTNLAHKILNKNSNIELNLNAKLEKLALDNLKQYWPKTIGTNAWHWVTTNLTDGIINSADYKISFVFTPEKAEVKKLEGIANVKKATVNYLDGMPKISNVNGVVYFAEDKIKIDISQGKTYSLNITKGDLSFFNFNEPIPQAKIDLDIKGSLTDALKVSDSEPLNLISKMGFKNEQAGTGDTILNLKLDFPLKHHLKGEEVTVNVDADITNAFFPKAFGKSDLSNGSLHLAIDNNALKIDGTAEIWDKLNARISCTENFFPDKNGIKSYKTAGFNLTENDRKRLNLNIVPFVKPYFTGDFGVEIALTNKNNGENFIGLKADLANTTISLPMIGWNKKAQDVASATVSGRILDNEDLDISRFTITSGNDFNIQGRFIIKAKDKTFNKINFSKFIVGRTDAKIILEKTKNLMNISIAGNAFDFNPIFKDAIGFGEKEAIKLPDMNINVAVEKMWGSSKGFIKNVGAILKRQNAKWQHIEVAGDFETTEKVLITLLPDSQNGLNLSIETNDAGSLFKTFGLSENIKSGYLRLEGYADSDNKMQGSLKMKDYRLLETPLLARILTMASLTGFADLLSGGGITFSQLDFPFVYDNGLLEINDAKTSGNSLGITINGMVDFKKNDINLKGLIAPAYVISKIIGNIPWIGKFLVGKDNGGVFAVSYDVKGVKNNPEITVNPLSALAPGFLRDLFGNIIPK
ncbi:MAG: AsmA-like C-terminal domain-containing protein [Alphaproteobacteria bacterium]